MIYLSLNYYYNIIIIFIAIIGIVVVVVFVVFHARKWEGGKAPPPVR